MVLDGMRSAPLVHSKLRLAAHLVAALSLACTVSSSEVAPPNAVERGADDVEGAEVAPDKPAQPDPSAPGPLPPAPEGPTYTVKDYAELAAALATAKAGEVIYVADSAEIDLTDKPVVKLAGGVTLKSGRGINGSKGARLFSTDEGQVPLIQVDGEGVTISGLRIEGPVKAERAAELKALLAKDKYYDMPFSRGIASAFSKTTIEYSELSGWTHCAICFFKAETGQIVRENYIHHNARYGLGYGVMTEAKEALVTKNLFDRNRHAIATPGKPGASYEASENVVFRGTYSHDFDVHGGVDRGDGTNIAGTKFDIHHNRYYSTVSYNFLIRGVPQDQVHVRDEEYAHANITAAVAVSNVGSSRSPLAHPQIFTIGTNKFGIARPAGIPAAPDVYLPDALAPLPVR